MKDRAARRVTRNHGDARAAGHVERRVVAEGRHLAIGGTRSIPCRADHRMNRRRGTGRSRPLVPAGFPISPRASVASSSCTRIGTPRSRRMRSAKPMWSGWPCVSTTDRTSASDRPMAVSSAGRSPQYPGAPASTIVTSPAASTRYEFTIPDPIRRTRGATSIDRPSPGSSRISEPIAGSGGPGLHRARQRRGTARLYVSRMSRTPYQALPPANDRPMGTAQGRRYLVSSRRPRLAAPKRARNEP
jgi:hypothetical protein